MIDCVYCGYEVCASDETLMFGWMMFSKIISKVSLTSSPLYNKVALSDYVMNPIDTHVYGPGVIFLDVIIEKTTACRSVCGDWCGWMQMSHLLECNTEGAPPVRS